MTAALSAMTLMLGLMACSEAPSANQEAVMQDAIHADLKREQDRVAAISDAALPPDDGSMMQWDGYPELSPGPELTADRLLQQVQAMAKALRAYSDTEPNNIEQVLGVTLPPDAKQERHGVTGRVGAGGYDWAVWKPFDGSAGHIVELTLTPDACLAYDAIKAPLEAEGFRVYVPTFGDDKRISFDKKVGPSLGLYIAATPDNRDAPRCVRVVSFELDSRDA